MGNCKKPGGSLLRIGNYREKVTALITLADGYLKGNDRKEALRLVSQAYQEAQRVEIGNKSYALTKTVLAYFRLQERDLAWQIMREVSEDDNATFNLKDAAIELAKTGDYDTAIEMVRLINSVPAGIHGEYTPHEEYRAEVITEVAIQWFKKEGSSEAGARGRLTQRLTLFRPGSGH